MDAYIHKFILHKYIHVYIRTHRHAHIYACMHVCVCVCVCVCKHTHKHTNTSYKVPNDRLLFFMEAFLNLFDANGIRADPQDVGGEVYILQSQYSNCIVTFIIVKNIDGFIHYGADV
jgi:hypothetical protein